MRRRAAELLVAEAEPLPADASAPLPITLLALLKGGYDSNVLLLPETSLARGSQEGDAFLLGYLSGSVELAADRRLVARAGVLDVLHADVKDADLDAYLADVEGRTPLGAGWTAGLLLQAGLYRLDRDSLFREAGVEATLAWDPVPEWSLEAGLPGTRKDYLQTAFEELDALSLGLRLQAAWRPSGTPVELRAVWRFLDENAEAAEQDHRGQRGELRFTLLPAPDWELRAEAWAQELRHGAPDPLLLETRRDRRTGGRLGATWTLRPDLQVFAELDTERGESTLDAFDYRRSTAALGATLSY